MIKEFKEFIARGNVLDLAVGVIIGGAFSSIVTSLVNNIFTPIIGIILGGKDFSNLSITVGSANIMYGAFIQSIIDFLIVAVCLFMVVKIVNRLNKDLHKIVKKEKEEIKEEVKEETKKEVKDTNKESEIALLEEIRDLLKEQKKGKTK